MHSSLQIFYRIEQEKLQRRNQYIENTRKMAFKQAERKGDEPSPMVEEKRPFPGDSSDFRFKMESGGTIVKEKNKRKTGNEKAFFFLEEKPKEKIKEKSQKEQWKAKTKLQRTESNDYDFGEKSFKKRSQFEQMAEETEVLTLSISRMVLEDYKEASLEDHEKSKDKTVPSFSKFCEELFQESKYFPMKLNKFWGNFAKTDKVKSKKESGKSPEPIPETSYSLAEESDVSFQEIFDGLFTKEEQSFSLVPERSECLMIEQLIQEQNKREIMKLTREFSNQMSSNEQKSKRDIGTSNKSTRVYGQSPSRCCFGVGSEKKEEFSFTLGLSKETPEPEYSETWQMENQESIVEGIPESKEESDILNRNIPILEPDRLKTAQAFPFQVLKEKKGKKALGKHPVSLMLLESEGQNRGNSFPSGQLNCVE